jgi:hypothetical protein
MTIQDAIIQSAEDLRLRVAEHQRLLRQHQEGQVLNGETCLMLDCPCRKKLRRTVSDAIEVLEETRRAFKSKQLEQLRKKLVGVLAEDA